MSDRDRQEPSLEYKPTELTHCKRENPNFKGFGALPPYGT
jgi:hypothetical protein